MDALVETRETNRRLNRRLGSVENHLHSMVSRAQRDTSIAQRAAAESQDRASYWVKEWSRLVHERSALKDTNDRLVWRCAGLLFWAAGASIVAAWLALR